MFDRVIVVVLDYPESKFAIEHRVEVLQTILRNSKGNYEVCVNRDNFERIDKRKAATLMRGCNVYASGNPKCIARMKELGYETLPTERSWDYEAHLEK
jgi:hypothetical protein